jgi:hypothetical protein
MSIRVSGTLCFHDSAENEHELYKDGEPKEGLNQGTNLEYLVVC